MYRYLKLYKKFFETSLIREMEYRLDFFVRLVIYLTWPLATIVFVQLLFYRTHSILGWNKNEFLILSFIYIVNVAVYKGIFHRNILNFNDLLRTGDFDFILTKPVNTRFLVSFRYFELTQIIRFVIFSGLLLWLVWIYIEDVTIFKLLLTYVLIFVGALAMYFFSFILNVALFWKPRLWNIRYLREQIQMLGEYPTDIYKGVFKIFVTILPVAVFATVPAKILLNKNESLTLIIYSIILCLLLWILSEIFWKFGLKHYESASS